MGKDENYSGGKLQSVLFVCTGNIFRSMTAEYALKAGLGHSTSPSFSPPLARLSGIYCLCRFILGLNRTFFLHFIGDGQRNGLLHRGHVEAHAIFSIVPLADRREEHGIDATITSTGRDSV